MIVNDEEIEERKKERKKEIKERKNERMKEWKIDLLVFTINIFYSIINTYK